MMPSWRHTRSKCQQSRAKAEQSYCSFERLFSGRFPHDGSEKACRVGAKGANHSNKLDHVQAPLSALVFRDKRLGFSEAFGDLRLIEASAAPGGF
jgi:hypothetical protein